MLIPNKMVAMHKLQKLIPLSSLENIVCVLADENGPNNNNVGDNYNNKVKTSAK